LIGNKKSPEFLQLDLPGIVASASISCKFKLGDFLGAEAVVLC
jgi:hypothetical protein